MHRRSRLTPTTLLGMVVLALLLWWGWQRGAEHRALLQLSPQERELVYARELASFRALCAGAQGPGALREQCRAKAAFLMEFPECEDQCRAATREYVSQPAR